MFLYRVGSSNILIISCGVTSDMWFISGETNAATFWFSE
jgi:hypothetical protein